MEMIRLLRWPGLAAELHHTATYPQGGRNQIIHSLLHHGTILYDFDIRRIRNSLREPIRQPGYRRGRTHDHFVVNAPISLEALLEGLRTFAAGL